MAISANLEIYNSPDALNTPVIAQKRGRIEFAPTSPCDDPQVEIIAPTRLIRNRYPVDGDTFPADLTDAERAQITASWWLEDFEHRARIELRKEIRLAFKREPSDTEYGYLVHAIIVARADGALPRDLNLANRVFHQIKQELSDAKSK